MNLYDSSAVKATVESQ